MFAFYQRKQENTSKDTRGAACMPGEGPLSPLPGAFFQQVPSLTSVTPAYRVGCALKIALQQMPKNLKF